MDYEAFYKLTYGLYIVSSHLGNRKNGYVCNTVFQVTAEPPQIAISCSKNNFTTELILNSKLFSVSVLQQDSKSELIGLFGYKSGKNINKFDSVKYITGKTGTPIVIDDSVAWFECNVVKEFDLGTHILIIGNVLNFELLKSNENPLTYAFYRDIKKGFAPQNAPTYIDKSKIKENTTQPQDDLKFECTICGYIYDPTEGDIEHGIAPNTPFRELSQEWECPRCHAKKDMFEPLN